MFREIERPPGEFMHLAEENHVFFEIVTPPLDLFDENNPGVVVETKRVVVAVAAVQVDGRQAIVHMEPRCKLTPAILKMYQIDMECFIDGMKRAGAKTISLINAREPHNAAWARFVQKLGFPPPVVMAATALSLDTVAEREEVCDEA